MGIYNWSSLSNIIKDVFILLFNVEVKHISNLKEFCFKISPAMLASSIPVWVSSTSVHPVNKFSWLNELCPWRMSTNLYFLAFCSKWLSFCSLNDKNWFCEILKFIWNINNMKIYSIFFKYKINN